MVEETQGEVRFEDVHFRDGEGDEVLHNIDFEMAPGEVVALVGPSGAGKTSIANLLCRFYDPRHGRVLVDGHDLRELDLQSLRHQISVVLQDTFLFNSTVRDNICYGKPNATDEEMIAAAKAAYAHEFIAHRLSTIRSADKNIALEEGRIREVGDHDQLLSQDGLYSQLYQRQLELSTTD